MSSTSERLAPHERTGVIRWDAVEEPATGGAYGDVAHGTAYTSRYVWRDGQAGGCAEVAYFPVFEMWGWDVCEQTTAGPIVWEDDVPRPSDAADITYEYPHALSIDSEEEAQALAKRYGEVDLSYALNLQPKEGN
jgi:hypothetical protein